MGLTIRDMGDTNYVGQMIASASPKNKCQVQRALDVGQSTLQNIMKDGGDLHDDWRRKIHQEIIDEGPISVWKVCI